MRDPDGTRKVRQSLAGAHAVVTGGAGFLGSHLCAALLDAGVAVTALDSLITGRRSNVAHLLDRSGFELRIADVVDYIDVADLPAVDLVLHLASPASPVDYLRHPIHTLKVGALGTHNALGLAKDAGARFLLASTSEVYGDPEVHPQPETYLGRVDPTGPRGVYDEAKRFAEAMAYAYYRTHGVDVRVARIFNTYGPGMRRDDGRLVPTLVGQALRGEPLTVHGDGHQTRSLCYVDDLVQGLMLLLASDRVLPCNIGSDEEIEVVKVAHLILEVTGAEVGIEHRPAAVEDPQRRRPDLTAARSELGWAATVALRDGLMLTIEALRAEDAADAAGAGR